MKKVLSLFAMVFLVSSCYTTYKVIPKSHNYSNSITYTIDKVEEGKSVATGGGSYHASRGSKFVFIFLTLENKINEKQDLNFDNFVLLDPKTKTKHKVEWSMVTGPINMWGKVDSYIRKGDVKKRKLVFLFPENEKPQYLMVHNDVIEIEYAK